MIMSCDRCSRSGVLESETSDDNSSVASVRQPPVKKRPRRTHYDLHSIASRLSGRTARRRMNHREYEPGGLSQYATLRYLCPLLSKYMQCYC